MEDNPFDGILRKAKSIGDNEGFILIQKFEPLPMINMLEEMGFEHYSEKLPSDDYKIYFHMKSGS